jgi:hypothetical protein
LIKKNQAIFFDLLSVQVTRLETVGLEWTLSKGQNFDVCSYYQVEFPWHSIWRVKVPAEEAFFVWTAAYNKILTVFSTVKTVKFLTVDNLREE